MYQKKHNSIDMAGMWYDMLVRAPFEMAVASMGLALLFQRNAVLASKNEPKSRHH